MGGIDRKRYRVCGQNERVEGKNSHTILKLTNCLQNSRILSYFTDKIETETMVFVRNTHEEKPKIFPFISL